jgi:hypothetical protein
MALCSKPLPNSFFKCLLLLLLRLSHSQHHAANLASLRYQLLHPRNVNCSAQSASSSTRLLLHQLVLQHSCVSTSSAAHACHFYELRSQQLLPPLPVDNESKHHRHLRMRRTRQQHSDTRSQHANGKNNNACRAGTLAGSAARGNTSVSYTGSHVVG